MSTTSTPADNPLGEEAVSILITLLLGTACGLIVANLYYAQPLVGPISASLGLSPEAAGLIVTMGQIGYVAGLLLIVPLGDLVENRTLVIARSRTASPPRPRRARRGRCARRRENPRNAWAH